MAEPTPDEQAAIDYQKVMAEAMGLVLGAMAAIAKASAIVAPTKAAIALAERVDPATWGMLEYLGAILDVIELAAQQLAWLVSLKPQFDSEIASLMEKYPT